MHNGKKCRLNKRPISIKKEEKNMGGGDTMKHTYGQEYASCIVSLWIKSIHFCPH